MCGETPIRADHRRELLEQCLQTMRVELDAAGTPEQAVTVVAAWADALTLLMERPVTYPIFQHHDPFALFV